MKIERIKKSHKKEIIIGGLILISIVSVITLVTTKARYRVTQDIKLARGVVNYVPYDYKIMSMYKSDDGTNYTEINEMPESGYVINEEKSYCNLASGSKDTTAVLKTLEGNHTISILNKGDKCYVWFDKKKTASEIILDNVILEAGTPDFSQVATDEGVYSISDGMYGGISYYFRGAVTNNYVKFAGFCWRIIRINGDNSLRIIYDGTSCHANGEATLDSIAIANILYNTKSNSSSYVGWTYTVGSQRSANNTIATASNAKIQTDNWFNNNFTEEQRARVVTGKFCNDRNVQSGSEWSSTGSNFYYASYNRIYGNTPTLLCSNDDIYELKVGTITADEIKYVGGKSAVSNKSYYLYNGQNYWSLSPVQWMSSNSPMMYSVKYDGSIGKTSVNSAYIGLRPVINLRSDITFSSGNGTQSNPYVVS